MKILFLIGLVAFSISAWLLAIYLATHHALSFAVLFVVSALWLIWCVYRAPIIDEPCIRRACMICKAPLDDGPPIFGSDMVSHGVCKHCAPGWLASQRFTPEQISQILNSHFQ